MCWPTQELQQVSTKSTKNWKETTCEATDQSVRWSDAQWNDQHHQNQHETCANAIETQSKPPMTHVNYTFGTTVGVTTYEMRYFWASLSVELASML